MKNEKGFTLIELLAIIVILAIIAVITVPIILGIVDEAKMNSAKDSAYGYKEAVSTLYASKILSNPSYSLEDRTYTVSELDTAGLSISGAVPESNSWINIENNQLVSACLQFGDYKVTIVDGKVGNVEKGECFPLYGYVTYLLYYYNSLANFYPTPVSASRPAETTAYLRYALTDGEIAPETVPDACLYSDVYGGELCLKNNEFEVTVRKIKDYFGYTTTGDNAWVTYPGEPDYWYDPNSYAHCHITATEIYCTTDTPGVSTEIVASAYSNDGGMYSGMVGAYGVELVDGYFYSFGCRIYGDGSFSCF